MTAAAVCRSSMPGTSPIAMNGTSVTAVTRAGTATWASGRKSTPGPSCPGGRFHGGSGAHVAVRQHADDEPRGEREDRQEPRRGGERPLLPGGERDEHRAGQAGGQDQEAREPEPPAAGDRLPDEQDRDQGGDHVADERDARRAAGVAAVGRQLVARRAARQDVAVLGRG